MAELETNYKNAVLTYTGQLLSGGSLKLMTSSYGVVANFILSSESGNAFNSPSMGEAVCKPMAPVVTTGGYIVVYGFYNAGGELQFGGGVVLKPATGEIVMSSTSIEAGSVLSPGAITVKVVS